MLAGHVSANAPQSASVFIHWAYLCESGRRVHATECVTPSYARQHDVLEIIFLTCYISLALSQTAPRICQSVTGGTSAVKRKKEKEIPIPFVSCVPCEKSQVRALWRHIKQRQKKETKWGERKKKSDMGKKRKSKTFSGHKMLPWLLALHYYHS